MTTLLPDARSGARITRYLQWMLAETVFSGLSALKLLTRVGMSRQTLEQATKSVSIV